MELVNCAKQDIQIVLTIYNKRCQSGVRVRECEHTSATMYNWIGAVVRQKVCKDVHRPSNLVSQVAKTCTVGLVGKQECARPNLQSESLRKYVSL